MVIKELAEDGVIPEGFAHPGFHVTELVQVVAEAENFGFFGNLSEAELFIARVLDEDFQEAVFYANKLSDVQVEKLRFHVEASGGSLMDVLAKGKYHIAKVSS